MIVDVHGHFTQTPPELDAYRGRQIMQLTRTGPKGDANISDDLLRKHVLRIEEFDLEQQAFRQIARRDAGRV